MKLNRQSNGLQQFELLIHWSLVDRAYSELARLRMYGKIELLFYCLCTEMRDREKIMLLPEELDKLIAKIAELHLRQARCEQF